ncbi:type VII secretion integral membrane protein EccD [Mycobacterium lacus]|uniref:ESX-4 secretion system protein eccD4 n=1 Tax=Mycobacterium lacus TaxID=169765 RepID=A0A1X1YUR8_9MYCO|nr:type VII secretion integral membrane protein EccD [Mycobacterium lacus]MCV7124391.1 type VII secretion integral membrane protein EccD [Mycobacterium lacus]ORW14822.1 type VII secretion integral membrane protein EccD [Mycobacterium lacus]BBX98101.1 ESX-4 secretion system protein eccD4 [Mycobacterium lacus]
MPASDPGLRRVSVHTGAAVVDVTLPAAVPVATLIPSIVDIIERRGAEPAGDVVATRYQLSRPGSSALPASSTLAQNDIRDGAVLVLSRSSAQPHTPRHHDVAEALAAVIDTAARPCARQRARLTGAVAAGCLTGVGALMLVRNAFDTNVARQPGSTASVAATAGLAALFFAVIAHRAYRDPVTALTLNVIATAFAAIAGLLAVPGTPGAPHVLLAAMAAAVTSVLALRVTGCGVVTLTALGCFAAVTAVTALARVFTAIPLHAVGSASALASLGLLEVSPRASIVLAGLAPRLPIPDGNDAEAAPATDRLAAKAIRADNWLTGLLVAFSSSAATGAIVTALAARGRGAPGIGNLAFAAVIGGLLLLRARSVDGRRTLVFVATGIATTATAFAVAAASAPQGGPWIAGTTAVLAAAAICLGSVAPAMPLSPVGRRGVELLECVALVAAVPMTCWMCGLFGTVRGLNLT